MENRIVFGSLEQVERRRVAMNDMKEDTDMMGVEYDSLNAEYEEDDEGHVHLSVEQQRMLAEFERKKRLRTLAVPTDDARVRQKLRELGEPITLFAEGPAERRDRLRAIMGKLQEAQEMEGVEGGSVAAEEEVSEEEEEEQTEEFYTVGVDELEQARSDIARYSLPRAKARVAAQLTELDLPVVQRRKMRHHYYTTFKIGDDRPLTYCAFSPDSKVLATSSWSGAIKLWDVPSCNHRHTFRGHTERVSGFDWHPNAKSSSLMDGSSNNTNNQDGMEVDTSTVDMVSGAVDGTVKLWSLKSDVPVGSLLGHDLRVCRTKFHPSGRYVATTSFDATWRFWDVATQQELLLQEGHSREVYALGFHPDGSLVGTGGMDCIGRVWDLRTGKSITVLQDHAKQILALDFAVDGYTVATGSEDNTIRVWDLRNQKCSYIIPAHTNMVTDVRFFKGDLDFPSLELFGEGDNVNINTPTSEPKLGSDVTHEQRRQVLNGSWLISSSYDGTVKVWSYGDWKLLKSLTGLESKMMACDVSGDARFIATVAYDRTFKLYAPEHIAMKL